MKTAELLIAAMGCAAVGGVAMAGSASSPGCAAKLQASAPDAGVACLERLRGSRVETLDALPTLTKLLGESTGSTDQRLILATLEALRSLGAEAQPAAESMSAMLSYRAAVYQQRDKPITTRLRTFLFATLADVGVPKSAEPSVLDALANFDERLDPAEIGAAARAAGSLGARGTPLAPYLVSLLSTRLSEEQFSLTRYQLQFAPSESTTVQIEALRALGNVAERDDSSVLEAIEHFTDAADADGLDPRAVQAARAAAVSIDARAPGTLPPHEAADPWIAIDARATPDVDVAVTDQDGKSRRLDDLLDRPVLVAFFYTRCQNDSKCSMTLLHLANLQRQLASRHLSDKVRLLAISYEPQHDTPERLTRFATDRGFSPSEDALLLRVDPERQQQVVDELLVPVSYNTAWVSAHGIECSLLDAHGRLVRKYSTVLWDNEKVVRDLERLLEEK